MPDDSTRTMRDSFGVWNVDSVEREVVLRSSDDQYVAVPIPEGKAEVFENLVGTSGTIDATLVRSGESGTVWQLDRIHSVSESM
ncbi:hypothetical protein [Halorussus litoreus]|uniref:hypothetical protein n=1 Tax=Halorussus litoreus TaxID=1710536 RepID=UPI000E27DDD3|nr:hypothetical protein [Halorussus litoreus]